MNIKRAANHDIRMNDEASARGQPQAPPFALPLLLLLYLYLFLPLLLLLLIFRFAASLADPWDVPTGNY